MTPEVDHPLPRQASSATSLAAFSLVELLVTVVVIGIIMALILPALSSFKRSAKAQKCVTLLHQQALLTTQYCADYCDYFPYAINADLTDPVSKRAVDVEKPFSPLGYITIAGSRPWVAMSVPFGKERIYRRPRCPADTRPDEVIQTQGGEAGEARETPASYWFSASLYIKSETLDPSRAIWGRASVRQMTLSSVRQPSRKALVFDAHPFHETWDANSPVYAIAPFARPTAAVDGSAQLRTAQEAINGVPLSAADRRVSDEQLGVLYRFMLTPNGVNGFDW